MATLHLLGTGAAVSDPHRTTTMLAFTVESKTLLVDCGGDVMQRAQQAGIAYEHIEALFLTHSHPDHVSGFPLFMERIWVAGRRHPIPVYGPQDALDHARCLLDVFDLSGWEGLPTIEWHPLEEETISADHWHLETRWVTHGPPTLGFRITARDSKNVVAYSCDTAPCDAVVELGRKADILIHEATGDFKGHSTAQAAAKIAQRAGAKRLVLVHLPPETHRDDLNEARQVFSAVEWGEEGTAYDF